MRAEQNPLWFAAWFKESRPEDYAFVSDYENTKTIQRSTTELLDLRADLEKQQADLEAMLSEAA